MQIGILADTAGTLEKNNPFWAIEETINAGIQETIVETSGIGELILSYMPYIIVVVIALAAFILLAGRAVRLEEEDEAAGEYSQF